MVLAVSLETYARSQVIGVAMNGLACLGLGLTPGAILLFLKIGISQHVTQIFLVSNIDLQSIYPARETARMVFNEILQSKLAVFWKGAHMPLH